MAQQPLVDQGLITIEASRSDSRHTTLGRSPLDGWSVRCRDLYPKTHNTHNRHPTSLSPPPRGIRTRNPSKPAAADLHFRPRAHWDRHKLSVMRPKFSYKTVKKLVVYMSVNTEKTVNILVFGDDAVWYGRCVKPP
jgi:hypothetical protein